MDEKIHIKIKKMIKFVFNGHINWKNEYCAKIGK